MATAMTSRKQKRKSEEQRPGFVHVADRTFSLSVLCRNQNTIKNQTLTSIHTARLLRSTLFCKHRRIVIDFACAVFECNGDQ